MIQGHAKTVLILPDLSPFLKSVPHQPEYQRNIVKGENLTVFA